LWRSDERSRTGLGLGAAGGAAAGLIGVLLSREPDAMLPKGITIDVTLDHGLTFDEWELQFGPTPPRPVTPQPILFRTRKRETKATKIVRDGPRMCRRTKIGLARQTGP
jgi:hypothetical protein